MAMKRHGYMRRMKSSIGIMRSSLVAIICGLVVALAQPADSAALQSWRVVLVAVYSKLTTDTPEGTAINYVARQFENADSRFSRTGSWDLFDVTQQKPRWINFSSALRP